MLSNIEISKELLSEVLKESIVEVYKIGSNPNFEQNTLLFKVYRCGDLYDINIYELAHKCKEWALDNGYYLTIHNDGIDVVLQTSCKMVENITDGSFKYDPRLVFKACQWILEKVNK